MRALTSFARIVDAINERVGVMISWVALLMVLVQFIVVVMRYVFGIGSVVMQESIVYMHATLFLVAAGYTLLHNGHVRCDIFYADATPKMRAVIDLSGVTIFLIPLCILLWWFAWPYVNAAWAVLEGSPEGRLGIPGVYLLKTTILVFVALIGVQGLSLAAHSVLVLAGIEADARAEDDGGEAAA